MDVNPRSTRPATETAAPRTTGRRAVLAGLASAIAVGGVAVAAGPAGAATVKRSTGSGAKSAPAGHRASRGIPFTAAEVVKNDDGSFTVSWAAKNAGRVTVHTGTQQDGIPRRSPVAHGAGTATVTVRGLGDADRQWFELVPEQGSPLTLADRSLHLASAANFRDAGGYRTSDGRWVRMGVLYRSGDLSKLTDADLAKLKRLGIRTDIDLRTESERTAAPDRLPAGADYLVADVLGGSISLTGLPATADEAVAYMEQAEHTMVSSATASAAFHTVLDKAGDRRASRVVYHCSAGKDRTGWASATILTALGVPTATVFEDYLASNTYRAAENAATLAAMPESMRAAYAPMLEVRPTYLQSGFDQVKSEFGTFDAYLRKGVRLSSKDLAALRDLLLVG